MCDVLIIKKMHMEHLQVCPCCLLPPRCSHSLWKNVRVLQHFFTALKEVEECIFSKIVF